ncbi:potassium-transporting ATPase subunit KdpC [Aeromicrobium duanguangcaii]|uniref:Potassium-transporting ATPase KdpC subunit n=1 Tax=Aeromicrobium duanguangcaii TaxID=2968086 RepID=A0ABY5KH40_9ACTN|nr:potassium-transporting ATPase subunit KdpC [Aeromicrobium duanguangcaii]MCD9153103.1 potassium-transporting ATPase subunit KdpC [Aeromicrobium duanguangcaii]UUI69796.1 potassium-transporting ATPase subunit KdpC [Aeromicrobium duanguangcaii]
MLIYSLLTDLARQSAAGLRLLLVLTVLLGVGYPAAVWAVAQPMGDRAAGQPVRLDGKVVGSALLGQQFEGERWFHSRPSPNDHDTLASAPSNLGPSSEDLMSAIAERRATVAAAEGVDPEQVPADALTASGSGLDPHISPRYARLQAPRVARANGLETRDVLGLIESSTSGRHWGFLGEPGVNVLQLNLAIARERP